MTAAILLLVLSMPQPYGPHLRVGDRRIILGLPGCGKSTLAEKLTADAHRVVWFDPEGDYQRPARLSVKMSELRRWPGLVTREPIVRVAVQPEGDSESELAAQVDELVALCCRAKNLVLVLDEVGSYRRPAESTINRVFRRGRHDGLVPILVSQVATDIPLTARKAASQVDCFWQAHASELAALKDTYGEAFAERASRWKPYDPPVTWRLGEGVT